jgi:hypothetical protein
MKPVHSLRRKNMASFSQRSDTPTSRQSHENPVSLAIVYRPVEQLQLSADNPRLHSEKQISQIAESIKNRRASGRKEVPMEFEDLDIAVAELQRVRDAAATSVSPAQRMFSDSLRLRAATAKALAAEIEDLLN